MRVLTAKSINELGLDRFRTFLLLEIYFEGNYYRYTNCDIPLVYLGNVYESRSFSIDNVSSSMDQTVDSVQIKLAELNSALGIAIKGSEITDYKNPQNAQVTIYCAVVYDNFSCNAYYSNATRFRISKEELNNVYEGMSIVACCGSDGNKYGTISSITQYTNCLKILRNGINNPGLRQTLNFEVGSSYKVFFNFKKINATSLCISIAGHAVYANPDVDWSSTPLSFTHTPTSSSESLLLYVVTNIGTQGMYLDSIEVRKIIGSSYGPNIVKNGYFDIDLSSWTIINSANASIASGGLIGDVFIELSDSDDLTNNLSYIKNNFESFIIFRGFISKWSMTEDELELTIVSSLARWNQRTLYRHPANCRWRQFGPSSPCGYPLYQTTTCDRSYERCLELGNQANFGGFRFLPSIENKEVLWGPK